MVSPNDFKKIFVGGQVQSGAQYVPAVYVSSNGGNTWTTHKLSTKRGIVYAVAVDPKNDNIVYAGGEEQQTYQGILFKSVNSGKDWTKIGGNIKADIYAISIDPISPSIVYVGTWSGVYKSVNSGSSWNKTSLTSSIKCLKVYPKNPKIVFAGGYSGIFYSSDRGTNWVEANKGLAVYEVNCIDWDTKSKIIYIGTDGGSVYKNTKLLKRIK